MSRIYEIALTMIPGIGDVLGKKLVALCGSAEAIFKEPVKYLRKLPRISDVVCKAVGDSRILERAEKEQIYVDQMGIRILFFQDHDYPRRFRQCLDSPVLLYYKGNANPNQRKVIGIVGTRSATDYGKRVTAQFVERLAEYEPLVISGLAYGIDGQAHRSALEYGINTIAVLGHGLDRIYPYTHKPLAERILHHGGLITEFITGTLPDRENFPRRNRIIAGMCDVVLVIEAALKGGALITADIANSYNRDVFAIPGRIGDPMSEGCNCLIQTNRAALVQSADDLCFMMGWKDQQITSPGQRKLFIEMTRDEEQIIKILEEYNKLGIDEISLHTEISMSKVSAALLNLEFEGVVKSWPGKIYTLL
jgi:DNA processing protein